MSPTKEMAVATGTSKGTRLLIVYPMGVRRLWGDVWRREVTFAPEERSC